VGVDVATVGDTRLELNMGWANSRASDRPVSGVEIGEDGFEPVKERNRLSFLDLISEAGRGMFGGAIVSGRGWLRSEGVSDASKPGGLLEVLVRNANGAAMRLVIASAVYASAWGLIPWEEPVAMVLEIGVFVGTWRSAVESIGPSSSSRLGPETCIVSP